MVDAEGGEREEGLTHRRETNGTRGARLVVPPGRARGSRLSAATSPDGRSYHQQMQAGYSSRAVWRHIRVPAVAAAGALEPPGARAFLARARPAHDPHPRKAMRKQAELAAGTFRARCRSQSDTTLRYLWSVQSARRPRVHSLVWNGPRDVLTPTVDDDDGPPVASAAGGGRPPFCCRARATRKSQAGAGRGAIQS